VGASVGQKLKVCGQGANPTVPGSGSDGHFAASVSPNYCLSSKKTDSCLSFVDA
jgi:hypothetical protein